MTVEVHQTQDGDWVVADDGGWLPGVYASEAMARAATEVPYGELQAWWVRIRAGSTGDKG